MLKVSLRNLFVSKLRLFLTVAAVTVGVSFVSGTFVLSDTMSKAFDELYAGLTSGTDVVVRAETAYELDPTTGGQPRPLDEGMVATVRALPDVAVADGVVNGFALVLDKDGKPMQPGGAPTIGGSIGDSRLAGDFTFRQGRQPSGADELALDAQTAKKAGYELGDTVDVVHQGGRQSFTLVGTIGFGETDSLLGATFAGFDLETAQGVLGKAGQVDEVDVKAVDGVSADELRDEIDDALPAGVEVVTGQQVADDGSAAVRDAMGVFTTVLLVFAGISVLVGSFVIWNTFNVLVAQRRREVALLRAVGASRPQVLTGVLVEAAVVGLVAGAIGLFAGVGIAAGIRSLLSMTGTDMPTTSPAIETRTVVAALAVGLLVTVFAAIAPAWHATRVAPMEALREAVPSTGGISTRRRLLGTALLVAGAAGLVACALVGDAPWWTGIATLTAFSGLVAVGPALARLLARIANHGPRGGGWRMAARNVARSSRRSAATALALTIGLTVVAAVAVTAASMKASVADIVDAGNRSDLILEPAGIGSGISPTVADELRGRENVADVVELRETYAQVEGRSTLVSAADPRGLDRVLDLGIQSGSASALAPGTVLVGDEKAEDLGVAVGDSITITFVETGPVDLRVVGTFSRGTIINATYLLTKTDFAANVTSELDATVFLTAAPGVDTGSLKEEVTAALSAYPNVTVNDAEDLTAEVQGSVDQMLGLVTALLLLAVVVAILGIVNTLVLSVFERTRELGLVRAVGGTRRQVRTVVRREAVLMSMLGALTGVGLGTLAGLALSRALEGQGITSIAIPSVTLVVYLLVASAVGVLAAIGPARRASKVDILQAITAE
jgi:putative ABC transport system permease protein